MTRPGSARRARTVLAEEDVALFREAVRGAVPLRAAARVAPHAPRPPAVPAQSLLDIHAALAESAQGPLSWEQAMETGEELLYLRPGLGRDVLKKLRRGQWVVQDELDLHGHTRAEARVALAEFFLRCRKAGIRCVRVVHGKGLRSPRREPVLKATVRNWLTAREEVLAFCQAPAHDGGSGAVLVLLKAG